MIATTAILQAMLISASLISTGRCEAGKNQVAWLQNPQNNDSMHVSGHKEMNDTRYGIPSIISINQSSVGTKKRDPKKHKPDSWSYGYGYGNKTHDDDESGVGKADISMPLSIGAGIVIVAMTFRY
ncbi:uncharacterized protein GGS22DRAFT_113797 [Annulohypoxylon maeteangense]|uniref:uncharacterized protein n=1 Tax=Annulohypoxylon maeteangense TaxID=1927788 RepID=UPI002008DCAE|nr:uncharacterized protein GGS22DRAFT_113797 [Annulohypoxylon maeteangense]KAI0879784.1 hypothetical protein GGS22DRAFT_113797 [Annulohypoxylon maeteangense]